MKNLGRAAAGVSILILPACRLPNPGGGGTQHITVPIDVTGQWDGSYAASSVQETNMSVSLSQAGSTVTGSYASLDHKRSGTIQGYVSGESIFFSLQQSVPCAGALQGSADTQGQIVEMAWTFSGADCAGSQSDGLLRLTKPVSPPS